MTTAHTDGVSEAGSWVAPASATPETGTFKGWPPKFVAQDPNLQWSKRVPAAGATLTGGTTYNVFLRLQVDPTPGDSTVDGVVVGYHDASGSHTVTWIGHHDLLDGLLTRQSRSTTTGAWSEAPCPARSSRSMNAPVTRSASGGVASTKSIFRPRSRSKRWR